MAARCTTYMAPSVGFGTNCAVCGYPANHKNHAPQERASSEQRARPLSSSSKRTKGKAPRVSQATRPIASVVRTAKHHQEAEQIKDDDDGESEDGGDDDSAASSHRSHTSLSFTSTKSLRESDPKKSVGKGAGARRTVPADKKVDKKQTQRSLSASLERSVTLHTMAADAARHIGKNDEAFAHYEEAVSCADKLQKTRRRNEVERKRADKASKARQHNARWVDGEARGDRRKTSGREGDAAPWNVDEPAGKIEREWGAAATMSTKHMHLGDRGRARGYLGGDDLDGSARDRRLPLSESGVLLADAGYDDRIREKLKLLFQKFSKGAPGLSKPAFQDLLEDIGCPGDATQCVAFGCLYLAEAFLMCRLMTCLSPHDPRQILGCI